MPKPVRELEKKFRPIEEQVMELLAKDPETAYTDVEIAARVKAPDDSLATSMVEITMLLSPPNELEKLLAPWKDALGKLEKGGRLRSFKDGTTVYYACVKKP